MAKLILFPPNIIFLYTSSNSSYRNSLKSILIISLYAPLVKGNLNVGTVLTVNTSLITVQNKNTKNRTGRERGGMGLIFNKYFKALLVTIVLCTGMFSFHIPLKAASMYPLQTKYPDIMLSKGKTTKKVIALTFDDGPEDRFTPQVLDVLKKYDVKATFLLLGNRVQKYPDTVKRIDKEDHIIGNHTYWHPELPKTGVQNMVW